MKFLSQWKLSSRFALIGLIGALTMLVPLAFYVGEGWETYNEIQLEKRGVDPAKTAINLIKLTQQHRGLSALLLGGKLTGNQDRIEKQKEIDSLLIILNNQIKGIPVQHVNRSLDDSLSSFGTKWSVLVKRISTKEISPQDSFIEHVNLIGELLSITDLVFDASGLSLDRDYGTYHLIRAVLYEAPELTENLGKLRAMGSGYLAAKSEDQGKKLLLNELNLTGLHRFKELNSKYIKVTETDQELKGILSSHLENADDLTKKAFKSISDNLIIANVVPIEATEYFRILTQAIDAQYKVIDVSLEYLERKLIRRAHDKKIEIFFVLAFLLSLSTIASVASIYIVKSIRSDLGAEPSALREIAVSISTGALNTKLNVNDGESSSVFASMAKMQAYLTEMVIAIRTSSEVIAAASKEIAQGNKDLSVRTENQVSTLDRTANSAQELSFRVSANAENASQASELAVQATEVAAKGGEVMSQVIETMQVINSSSERIYDIVSVIDGIAFQTNILALNAAVEAARAGEQGRGFAVVATEVRSLAGRCSTAAKEIKSLITGRVEQIETGTNLVRGAGQTINDVVSSIERVSVLIDEVSSSCRDQAGSVDDVGGAVKQMDRSTQENATLVEEMAAAAVSLEGQANDLVGLVGKFKL